MTDRPVYEIPLEPGVPGSSTQAVPPGFTPTQPAAYGPPPGVTGPPPIPPSLATAPPPSVPGASAASPMPSAPPPTAAPPPAATQPAATQPAATQPSAPATDAPFDFGFPPPSTAPEPTPTAPAAPSFAPGPDAGAVPFPSGPDAGAVPFPSSSESAPPLRFAFPASESSTDSTAPSFEDLFVRNAEPAQAGESAPEPSGSSAAPAFGEVPFESLFTEDADEPAVGDIIDEFLEKTGEKPRATPQFDFAKQEADAADALSEVISRASPITVVDAAVHGTVPEALQHIDPDLIAALRSVAPSRASDLHVTAGSPPTLRVDGSLRALDLDVWDAKKTEKALLSALSPERLEQFTANRELDWALTISPTERFRVNYYVQRGAIGAAFRIIPTKIKSLAELDMPSEVARFAALPRGLVLVTGPTGSGKSTTLAALIDLVNQTRADHIVTVEDPIEYMHTSKRAIVNQREVGEDTESFTKALKHVLRQDPDVILVGEMRDLETISVALTAAETGHLVFATLHTQSAAQTIDRVIDVFPPHQQNQIRSQLSVTLQGVVCQTLVRNASGEGRTVATELMFITPAIANVIREGKTYQVPSMLQSGRELGMHSMDQALAELVNDGRVTHEAALEKVHDPETFSRLARRKQGS